MSSCCGDRKQFTDQFVVFSNIINNSKVFRKSTLNYQVQYHEFFCVKEMKKVLHPHLLGDHYNYPLFFWMMILHKDGDQNILEVFITKRTKEVNQLWKMHLAS
jgi:hypothetical protein